MLIHHAKYTSSHTKLEQCPVADRPEYAFIGRSNVGKSSLINMLCDHKSLAKTSSQPGKTQTINYFDIDKTWYLVDLPGYGYARIAERTRQHWKKMIHFYMRNRTTMQCAFLLVDTCVQPQEKDIEFANWMGKNGIPFVIVFTKTDRKKSIKRKEFLDAFKTEFLKHWSKMPQYFFTSSELREGKEELLDFIGSINDSYYEAQAAAQKEQDEQTDHWM